MKNAPLNRLRDYETTKKAYSITYDKNVSFDRIDISLIDDDNKSHTHTYTQKTNKESTTRTDIDM